jgi:hypothetical protein
MWGQMSEEAGHRDGYDVMIGNTSTNTTLSASIAGTRLYVPIPLWFTRESTSAFPIGAIVNQTVKLRVKFRASGQLVETSAGTLTTPVISNAYVLAEYVYLSKAERDRVIQSSHEFLIEQVQALGVEQFAASNFSQKLTFNHPIKSLIWGTQLVANETAKRLSDFTDGSTVYAGADPMASARITVNNYDRVSPRDALYYNVVQARQHFNRVPNRGIYAYSFADKPMEMQPTGTINASRLDNFYLKLTMVSSAATKVYTYATSYNVAKIASGIVATIFAS